MHVSFVSNQNERRMVLIVAVVALAGLCSYLAFSALAYHVGFPLDDSWIHLTYARNLAEHGQWAFQLGRPSAGSTAPLWTALLSIGFWLQLAPYVWTYLIGWITLIAIAVLADKAARRLIPTYHSTLPWVGIFITLEWHLLWAAASGMETLLHGLLIFAVLSALTAGSRRYLTLGLLTGLSVWVRPDGLTLLGPILLTSIVQEKTMNARGQAIFKMLLGFGALFVPYLFFNLALSGSPMPNTFYAKQAEYAIWQAIPLIVRIERYSEPLLASPFVVLLPGVFLWAYRSFQRGNWGTLMGMIWFVSYVGVYLMRLPAYQHGRYLMPAMPILFFWGLLGLLEFVLSIFTNKFQSTLAVFWKLLTAAVSMVFIIVGARAYALDVAFIESEMVVTAMWAAQNLPSEAVLAVHDIGAIGYFDGHELLDLAGLVSPEVVPFIRDETRLAKYLDEKSADYLITFPAFYPQLTAQRSPIFTTNAVFAPEMGGENISVYRWPP